MTYLDVPCGPRRGMRLRARRRRRHGAGRAARGRRGRTGGHDAGRGAAIGVLGSAALTQAQAQARQAEQSRRQQAAREVGARSFAPAWKGAAMS